MKGFSYIVNKQKCWAERNRIKLVGSKVTKGEPLYTSTLNANLFENLLPETEAEIENGDGGELTGSAIQSPKMSALHSSSALGVNILQYWRTRNLPQLAYSLGLCRQDNQAAKELHFEKKLEISNKFRFDPNLDALILNNNTQTIKAYGIECKFSEAYSSRNHPGLKEKYLTEIPEQWEDIPKLYEFAQTISPIDNSFHHLHPAQLVKHILGLKKEYGKKGFRLLYLWYDVPGEDGYIHQKEIETFTNIAKQDNINFHSIS